MSKQRLDVLMTEKALAESREKAKALIMSGVVYVGGKREDKPGAQVNPDAEIEVRGEKQDYVSRGGYKLERALDFFGISPEGLVCLDCGASTGGFTHCLLKRGAKKVYAIDVGDGQLAWTIRNDPRVVTMERTNIRYVTPEQLEDKIELAVIDVSFISLKLVLPAVRQLLKDGAYLACLIKPQFEAGREKVGKKGVVRDLETHVEVLESFIKNAEEAGFTVLNLTNSPIKGPEGNIEFLGHLSTVKQDGIIISPREVAERAHTELKDS
ncbi:MAG: TlyA family RNA methyltransferase [Oscillospiraceae bacterium]|nr:TlyA family RNA methyltransferase [Oscillospiraceae bacterium]